MLRTGASVETASATLGKVGHVERIQRSRGWLVVVNFLEARLAASLEAKRGDLRIMP